MDSWVDFTAQEVELPATLWLYPVIGYMPVPGAAVTEKAKADLARALAVRVLTSNLLTWGTSRS